MEPVDRDAGIDLAELMAAFSPATDLGLGQPKEHVLRSWRIAERLAERMGLPEDQRRSLFYVSMLAWVGCVADSPEVAASFGDDIAFRADSHEVDLAGAAGFGFFLRLSRGGALRWPGDDRVAAHREPPAAKRRVPTGQIVISGPSTDTSRFVC